MIDEGGHSHFNASRCSAVREAKVHEWGGRPSQGALLRARHGACVTRGTPFSWGSCGGDAVVPRGGESCPFPHPKHLKITLTTLMLPVGGRWDLRCRWLNPCYPSHAAVLVGFCLASPLVYMP